MNRALRSVTVQPADKSDVPDLIDFLRNGFVPHFAPERLRGLFEYRWSEPADKPNLGYLLRAGVEIVGFLGAVYAERPLSGRSVKTCNMTSWYVAPKFRWASMKLLYALMSQKEYAIINLSASPEVRRVMEALRFETIDFSKMVYLPWHFPARLLQRGPEILTEKEAIAHHLQADELRILRDHAPYQLRHYLLCSGDQHSYIVLKRRSFPGEVAFGWLPFKKPRRMWYPSMEVLFLSNPEVAIAQWPSLVASIFRRERVLGVVAAERLFSGNPPPGARLDHRNYLLSRARLEATIDSLYSELVVI
jgi:acetoacetyl-CoA synthetase